MPSVTAQPDLTSPAASSRDEAAPGSPRAPPEAVHRLEHGSSVLALAVSAEHGAVYAGTQDGEIVAWSLATFHQLHQVQAHKRSLLSLFLSPDASLLFSSAGDAVVNVWCPRTLRRLYEVYGIHDVGDVFCTAYSAQRDSLYIGAQNTSIQWVCLGDAASRVAPGSQSHPDRRSHRFFDSKAIGGSSTPRRSDGRWGLIPRAQTVLEMDGGSIRRFAHNGYVYCMLMATGPTVEVDADDDVLISGGGDGTIKLWSLGGDRRSRHRAHGRPPGGEDHPAETAGDRGAGIEELMTLGSDDAESVLSLALDGSFLYAGKLDGIVELWDLDTAQRLRVIKAHGGNVMSLQMGWGYLWTASTNGCASRYSTAHYGAYRHASSSDVSQKYQCLSKWRAHEGKILASAVTTYGDHRYFITGANDRDISIWSVKDKACPETPAADGGEDLLFSTLADFVSYKTVSSRPEYAEDCRKGATFLGALLKRLGGHVEMLSTDKAHNPVVYALFAGKKEAAVQGRKRILFYGHYDVVAADNRKGTWLTDPFTLTGTNGFLYGRGVSDNKGPIVAALYAVTDLMQAQRLENDIVFLIEGEEEFGSRGFEEAVRRHRDLIGHVDYVLLANSYWLDDEVPCLTYGLRGVLHATVCVDAPRPDLHSGVDGSYMLNEPLSDLTSILSRLKGAGNRIQIPGFYDGVPPMGPEEEARLDEITSMLTRRGEGDAAAAGRRLKQSLTARWREPNLTIHRYKVSGPEGSLVSSHASSHISLRLVPGQEVDDVAGALAWFLRREFGLLRSQNRLSVNVDNRAEPWLGDPTNAIFRTLGQAIVEAWPACFDGGGAGGGAATTDSTDSRAPGAEDAAAAAAAAGGTRGEGAGDGATEAPAPRHRSPTPTQTSLSPMDGPLPDLRFLEKEFGAPAAHLPCGRASDAAHLDNERMSMVNLLKAREIFGKVFARL